MSFQGIDHIRLCVESLQQAENYYRKLFCLQPLHREAAKADVAQESSQEAETPDCGSVLLGGGGFRLALSRRIEEFSTPSRIEYICLCADVPEITRLRQQVEELGCLIQNTNRETLTFEDHYGVCWKVIAVEN